MTNPLNDGFTLPFEGNKHCGTIILLPYRADTWEDGGNKAFSEFKEIIFSIAKYEHVYVIKSKNVKYDVSQLYNKENIQFKIITLKIYIIFYSIFSVLIYLYNMFIKSTFIFK